MPTEYSEHLTNVISLNSQIIMENVEASWDADNVVFLGLGTLRRQVAWWLCALDHQVVHFFPGASTKELAC